MRSLGALLVLFLSLPAAAQSRASRCWAACERNVTDPRLRATSCSACLTSADGASAWLARLPETPPHLLEDEDWEVRWAGLLAEARKTKTTAPKQLALWVARAQGDEVQRACLTGVHAAGAIKTSLTTLLAGEARALELCAAREKSLRDALWVDLYAESAPIRREALTHLSRAYERAPARVVLDALPTHAAAFDELLLDTFASWALELELSPAAALLSAATPADVASMNRVLAVYSRRRDAARPLLTSTDELVRRQALSQLAELAPISEAELLGVLADPKPGLRLFAARALARGENRSLAAMTGARLSGERPATAEQRLVLLGLVGDRHEADCTATLLETWRDPKRPVELRSRALVVAASCSWAEAKGEVEAALAAKGELERSTAVAALGFAPKNEQLTERLTRASNAPEASMRAAACQAVGQQRWRGGTERLVALAADPEPSVRSEALRGLVALDAPGLEARLSGVLESDVAAPVRATAAELLGRFGGPRATSALDRAARNDTDANVKLVAAQSLRKLAPGSLPP